jgi:hypothetical protein
LLCGYKSDSWDKSWGKNKKKMSAPEQFIAQKRTFANPARRKKEPEKNKKEKWQ